MQFPRHGCKLEALKTKIDCVSGVAADTLNVRSSREAEIKLAWSIAREQSLRDFFLILIFFLMYKYILLSYLCKNNFREKKEGG